MNERIEKLAAFASKMTHLSLEAGQKWLIFDGLTSEDLRGRLANSYGANAYHVLTRTLIFDLIRDVWAFTLDRDSRAPSIANIWAALGDAELRSAFRERFDDSNELEWWGPDWPAEERERCMRQARAERREAALATFDNQLQTLDLGVGELLGSDLAARLDSARKRGIAHYNMVKTANGHDLFDVTTLGLRWEDPKDMLTQASPIILGIAGIIARASFDVAEFDRVHRLYAQDLWSRIMGIDRQSHSG